MFDLIKWFYHWTMGFQFSNIVGFVLYWIPVAVTGFYYFIRTVIDYRADLKARDEANRMEAKSYYPSLHVGAIIKRVLIALIPVANLFVTVFRALPDMLGEFFTSLFSAIEKFFDVPLVPPRRK